MNVNALFRMLVVGIALVSVQALSQPTIGTNGVVNSASYAQPGLPNFGVAQGSIFTIFGQNLGPAKIVQVSSFPLPTSAGLSGTSVQVTVNGTQVYAIMLYTLATQVAAVLPSNTPVGTGTVTATYNGQTSNAAPITVVARSFGIFATNQSGSGQGVLQNVNSQSDRPFNGPSVSAQPGQTIILWGTGLGPVSGNEAGEPLPGDMPNLNIHVYVGGVEAKIQYRGRSGCCVGDDQIVFTVPAGVEGCALPVYVVIDGIVSNFVTMSVGANGAACEDAGGLTAAQLEAAQKNGGLKIGVLAVGRFISEPSGKVQRNDNVSATFEFEPLSDFGGGAGLVSNGACTVLTFPSHAAGGALPQGLEVGTVTAATPVGTYPLPEVQTQKGTYLLTFFPIYPNPAPPGIINDGTLLTGGTTTISFTGGSGISGGSGSIDFPLTFQWTNDSAITKIDRSQPLTILWTGGTKGDVVNIFIQSQASLGVGAELICAADASLGTFTISPQLLSALPPSYLGASGTPQASISVEESFYGTFSAAGLDFGQTQFHDTVDKAPILIQ